MNKGGTMEIKCKYDITYREVKRGYGTQHLYCVDGEEYPSVSAIVNLLDDGKSNKLIHWAVRLAVDNLAEMFKNGNLSFDNIEALVKIAKKKSESEKQKAADIGTQCHNAIDAYINKDENYKRFLIDDKAKNSFNLFWDWLCKNKLKIICGDMPTVSKVYKYGGRPDALATDENNNIVLLDWKTSNHIQSTYAYQIAAYAISLEESYNIIPKRAFVIRFGKEDDKVEE